MFGEVSLEPQAKIDFGNFKTIMMGGMQSPMINSPYNKHRKRLTGIAGKPGGAPPNAKGGGTKQTAKSPLFLASVPEKNEQRALVEDTQNTKSAP